MDKEIDDAARNKRINELSLETRELDDICRQIWFTLLAKERLRFTELHKTLKKLGINISKPTLTEHLGHLIKQKFVKRKVEGFQNVSYGLTDEIYSLIHEPEEDLVEWLEVLEDDKGLRGERKAIDFLKTYYEKMSDKQLDQETDRELETTLALCLFELKNLISYDLKTDKHESDAAFWNFIGNPLYRMHERDIAETCRESDRYKAKLFEKMETLIDRLRSHTLLRSP